MLANPSPARMIPASSTLLLGLLLFAPAAPVAAQDPAAGDTYQLPPPEILAIAEAPPTPVVIPAPDRRSLLIFGWEVLTPIAELAEDELRLAGQRIQPHYSGPSRTRPYTSVAIFDLATRRLRQVEGLPAKPWLINLRFSPSGRLAAFSHRAERGWELWLVDLDAAKARRISEGPLSLTLRMRPLGQPLQVAPSFIDEDHLAALLVPEGRGLPPAEKVPAGPVVLESLGATSQKRTQQDLLRSKNDEDLFRFYTTAQLVRIGLDGKVVRLGRPAIYSNIDPSPDGRYLLVETLEEPFSHVVLANDFATRIEILSAADGAPLRRIADRPLQESIPLARGSVTKGPRRAEWRADAPATLVWAEAQDGGDSGAEALLRDRLYALAAPFRGEPIVLASLALRYDGVLWGNDRLALVGERQFKDRKTRTWRIYPGEPARAPELLVDRSTEDRYADPGDPVMWTNAQGRPVLLTGAEGSTLHWIGEGASPEGTRPFLDRHHLAGGRRERLFRSEAPFYEEPVMVLDPQAATILTRRESADEPPNYFLRSLPAGAPVQLTSFPHPAPQLRGLRKELIKYQRADGLALSGTLYLPPGYDSSQGPLPTLLWAYPHEFKNADAASQVKTSPYRFDPILGISPLLFLAKGYAVLDDPQMPIVGEKDQEPNDTFVEQLAASARAAVDELVRRGVAKPGHIAVGGHSYGAFMTANLLAHTDLFAAGLAFSGAYNRSLTPFGFQSEERTFWQAPAVYGTMSPFNHADRLKEPILLVHGEADNNPGTFPLQSERFYSALKGHGAIARYVSLPLESHSYQARESILHVLWESWRWLDTYIGFHAEDEEKRPEAAKSSD